MRLNSLKKSLYKLKFINYKSLTIFINYFDSYINIRNFFFLSIHQTNNSRILSNILTFIKVVVNIF